MSLRWRSVLLLRISHTADVLETDTTASCAMLLLSITVPFDGAVGSPSRCTARVMPSTKPASLPLSMYTASSATYLILKLVLMLAAMDFVTAVVAARALGLGISTCPTLPRLAVITPLEGATPWLVPDPAGGAAAVTPAPTPEALGVPVA